MAKRTGRAARRVYEEGKMRAGHLAACAAVAASLASASAAMARPPDVDSSELRSRVTVDRIVAHQRALQSIATTFGGTRYTTTPGYAASANYVESKMRAAGYNVSVTQFNMPEWRENSPPVFEQLTPTAKTYTAGTAADDSSA